MRTARSRGMSTTEVLLTVVGVAVALLIVALLFGRKISQTWSAGAGGLDGKVAVNPNGGGGDQLLPGLAVDSESIALATTATGIATQLTFGKGFTQDEQAAISAAAARLPQALRDLLPTQIKDTKKKNVQINAVKGILFIGDFALRPNDPGGINDFFQKTVGVNPGFTVERILFHELLHVFHTQNSEVVDALFAGFASRKSALESDSAFFDATLEKTAVEGQISQLAKEKGLKAFDKDGVANPEVFDKILSENPDLKKDLQAANRKISDALLAAGFPSRFPGDDHALKNPREFFAILVEMAKFQPSDFAKLRQKANGSTDPDDPLKKAIDFLDAHPELLK